MEQTNDPIMQTAGGKTVNLALPKIDDVDICDIAQALGRLCRFTGHTKKFYSVAEHCVNCCDVVLDLVPTDELATWTREQKRIVQLEALMHDASEAFIGDVSRPLKSLLPRYKELERAWERVIADVFGVGHGKRNAVAHVDQIMNVTEFKHLMVLPSDTIKFNMVVTYDDALNDFKFHCLDCEDATQLFLSRFAELTGDACAKPRTASESSITVNTKSRILEVATEHQIRLIADDLIVNSVDQIAKYVQTVAGTEFLACPDNTIKDHLVALLMAYDARLKTTQIS